jgi:dTDP-L-rhamnose 4-epimerase
MRVLVTGGAGFIGSHVVEALLETGHEPVVADALLASVHGPDARPELPPGVEFAGVDIRDGAAVEKLLIDLPDYVSCNDHATAVLLAAMARTGVRRLVLASSMVVYGEGRYRCERHGPTAAPPRRPADLAAGRFEPACPSCGDPLGVATVPEETSFDPRNGYAATKAAQEYLVRAWARETGSSAIALRYHNVYGPRMPRDTPYSGVAALFRSALAAGRPPTVFEDGGQLRDFVHVQDVARANVLALAALSHRPLEAGSYRAYNVASGHPCTIGDVAWALATAGGGPLPVVTGEYRLGDVRHIVADPRSAARELGFRAAVRWFDGMRDFATDRLRDARAGAPSATAG